MGVDPLAAAQGQEVWSPYAAMGNSPESMIDPNGLMAIKTDVFDHEGETGSNNFGSSMKHWLAMTGGAIEFYGGGGGGDATPGANAFYRNMLPMEAQARFDMLIANGYSPMGAYHMAKNFSSGEEAHTNDGGSLSQELREVTVTANKGKTWFGRMWRNVGGKVLDVVQTALDVAGLVPGLGEAADLINAGIYTIRGDYSNAALSLAAAVPFVGWGATGVKIGRRVVSGFQKHHVIPNAVYKSMDLKSVGWIQDAGVNLKKLPTPFHGNHPAYNHRVREGIMELQERGNFNQQGIMDLQNRLRQEINEAYSEGWERLNYYYKAKGYTK